MFFVYEELVSKLILVKKRSEFLNAFYFNKDDFKSYFVNLKSHIVND